MSHRLVIMAGVEELGGRTAVVTGAASGIGLGMVDAFAKLDMRIVMADIDEGRLERESFRLSGAGTDVLALRTDVSDPAQLDALAEAAYDRFGAVHVLCNNAGTVTGGPTWELTLDQWHRVLDVNLMGVIHGIHSFVPRMVASGEPGHVVNTGSMASVQPVPGIAPYNASKHAVLAITETLRADLESAGAPIGTTVVMPGRVHTRLGRSPEDPDLTDVGPVEPDVLEPPAVAQSVIDAITRNELYVFTHRDRLASVKARFNRILGVPE